MLVTRIRSPLIVNARTTLPSKCRTTTSNTTTVTTPLRHLSTIQERRVALRAARKKQAAQYMKNQTPSGSGGATVSGPSISTNTLWYLGFAIPTGILTWGIYDDESPPAQVADAIGLTDLVSSMAEGFTKPIREKLLPDWSMITNVPQDIPVPHTLVLDLEETLVSSTWDRKHGWRHAKRPGVDKFLTTLSQYYEIVVWSPSVAGLPDEVINALDTHGCIMHRLYRDGMLYKKGEYIKDLSKLNRNLKRIVAIDDDERALQLQPGNLIKVKPYTDPTDREDRTLINLLPLLVEIARENYQDVPTILHRFDAGGDADAIAAEYQQRIHQTRESRSATARRGLGRLAPLEAPRPEPAATPVDEFALPVTMPGQLTAKDVVGAGPSLPGAEDGSGVVGWLNRRSKEKQEEQMRKIEKWNEVMMKKQMEKKREMEEQQQH